MESDESARNIPVAAYKVLERTGIYTIHMHAANILRNKTEVNYFENIARFSMCNFFVSKVILVLLPTYSRIFYLFIHAKFIKDHNTTNYTFIHLHYTDMLTVGNTLELLIYLNEFVCLYYT